MTSSSPRLLECSALMRSDLDPWQELDLSDRSPAARRRHKLCRGIDRWCTAMLADGLASGRVLLLTLTFADADPNAARGTIRTFWHHYRQTFGKRPYFSWAELQFRGAVHYHAILLRPPWKTRGDSARWISRYWPHASITPSLEWRPRSWFVEKGANYVKKYARAPEKSPRPRAAAADHSVDLSAAHLKDAAALEHQVDKSYQQAYEDLPREIRTFQHSVLPWLMSDVDLHRSRHIVGFTSSARIGSDEWLRSAVLMQKLHHRWPWQACTLRTTQKRPRSVQARGRFKRRGSHVAAAHPART